MAKKPRELPKLRPYFDAMKGESDRAVGVLGASILDAHLESLFRNRMPDAETSLFDYRGPLGDFAGRIDMAHALRWIDDDTKADLDVIRLIRNDFAHIADHAMTFATQSIKDRTQLLRTGVAIETAARRVMARLFPGGEAESGLDEALHVVRDPRTRFVTSVSIHSAILSKMLTVTYVPPTMAAPMTSLIEDIVETVIPRPGQQQ